MGPIAPVENTVAFSIPQLAVKSPPLPVMALIAAAATVSPLMPSPLRDSPMMEVMAPPAEISAAPMPAPLVLVPRMAPMVPPALMTASAPMPEPAFALTQLASMEPILPAAASTPLSEPPLNSTVPISAADLTTPVRLPKPKFKLPMPPSVVSRTPVRLPVVPSPLPRMMTSPISPAEMLALRLPLAMSMMPISPETLIRLPAARLALRMTMPPRLSAMIELPVPRPDPP